MIETAVNELEKKALSELPMVEAKVDELVKEGKHDEAKRYVTDYTDNFALAAMKKWEDMKVAIWGMFARGF